jgi:asparagine synthase (glutamine-hydrolysing)
MCGILAVVNFEEKLNFSDDLLKVALNVMESRGPDNSNWLRCGENVIVGHVRLSIIDHSVLSNQPFIDDNERYVVVYNGEIFNFVELRNELMLLGYKFRTLSDTEVLLKSYIAWGEECVQKFNGMWAFAIYDKRDKSLFCSRDRFGEKPLYIAQSGNTLIICSTIKSILQLFPEFRIPNYNVISKFCKFYYGAQYNDTWFENIFRLPPAHNLKYSKRYGLKREKYWDYPNVEFQCATDIETIKEEFLELFQSAVNIRYRSDVPISISLSGGLDSNAILFSTAFENRKNLTAYSVGLGATKYLKNEITWLKNNLEVQDESIIAEKSAKSANVKFERVIFSTKNCVNQIQKLIYHLECGHQSLPIIPYNQLMSQVAKGYRVTLDGQGADELLAGYVKVTIPEYFVELISRGQLMSALKLIREFSRQYSLINAFKNLINAFDIHVLKMIYLGYVGKLKVFKGPLSVTPKIPVLVSRRKNEGYLNYKLRKAHRGTLVSLLHYGDSISMCHSVESRSPFMDYRLVEFVFKLDSSLKIRNGVGKFLLRDAMKGIVPEEILQNKIKLGFSTPLLQIFLDEGKDSPMSVLLSQKCLDRGLFDGNAVKKIFANLRRHPDDVTFLYKILCVELWFREFIDND